MRESEAWLWAAAVVVAVAAGATVTRVPVAYVWAFVALALVVVVFLWRSQEPMVPFLLLVAAMQGGVLLRLPLGDAPVSTLMPFLGGWVLIAVLVSGESRRLAPAVDDHGKWLVRFIVAFGVVVTFTAVAQNWRPGGRVVHLSEVLTLVQLGVLIILTAYVLSSPRRVLWVAYVTIAAGVAAALVALADQAGLITLGTEMAYTQGYTRVSGLTIDPNFFSFQLLIALAFNIHVALAAKKISARILLWLSCALILGGIVSSYSAGALVGVAAVLGATVLLQLRVSAMRAGAALVLIAALTAVVAAFAPSGYTRAVTEKYSEVTSSSFEHLGTDRGAAWQAALREVVDNPVMGVGMSTESQVAAVADHYTLYRTDRKAAHNTYLGIAVETGLLGLAAFVAVLASCFSILWAAFSKATGESNSETALATACLFTALVVAVSQGLQLDLEFEKYLWLLIGACIAVRHWPSRLGDARA